MFAIMCLHRKTFSFKDISIFPYLSKSNKINQSFQNLAMVLKYTLYLFI